MNTAPGFSSLIHPTALVDPEAVVAPTARIGVCTIVEKGATVGAGTEIGANCRIYTGTTIGAGCRIDDFAVIGAPPQSISFDTTIPTFVEIGDGCDIGAFASIHRGTEQSHHTRLGRNCRILPYCHVAHDGHIGDGVTIGARTQLGGHVEIGDHSIIVEGTALHQFTRIGRLCCLESGARKDIPPFALYVGREGDFDGTVAGANRKGMEDAGFSPETIGAIERAYEILLDSGLNTTQAAQAIGTELAGSPEAAEIVAFLAGSKRGLARGGKR